MKESKLEKNVQSIVGSFVLVNNKDHQSFRTAEIIKQVSPGYYFVQFDNMGGDDMPIPIELVGEAEMASVCENCGERLWSFFPSREGLQKYIDWMATPAEPKMKVGALHQRSSQARPANQGPALTAREPDGSRRVPRALRGLGAQPVSLKRSTSGSKRDRKIAA